MLYRMIKYKEKLLPWSGTLSALEGAEEVEMSKNEIDVFFGREEVKSEQKTSPSDKPGPGWVKNQNGAWERKAKKETAKAVVEPKADETVNTEIKETKKEKKKTK
jgi:flagellar biosynthesis/type III secretory pathway M-ring protein FliF/YscJ